MIMKTAIITLVSTLLIAIMALSSQDSGSGSKWAGTSTRGGTAMSVTGASGSFSGGGQRGNWGRGGSMSVTGASGSFSGGGQRGDWGRGEHDDHDDHDGGGWEGDDD